MCVYWWILSLNCVWIAEHCHWTVFLDCWTLSWKCVFLDCWTLSLNCVWIGEHCHWTVSELVNIVTELCLDCWTLSLNCVSGLLNIVTELCLNWWILSLNCVYVDVCIFELLIMVWAFKQNTIIIYVFHYPPFILHHYTIYINVKSWLSSLLIRITYIAFAGLGVGKYCILCSIHTAVLSIKLITEEASGNWWSEETSEVLLLVMLWLIYLFMIKVCSLPNKDLHVDME